MDKTSLYTSSRTLYWNGRIVWTPALGLTLIFREDVHVFVREDVHFTSNVITYTIVGPDTIERRLT